MSTQPSSAEAEHAKGHDIVINGKKRHFDGPTISYEQVVQLAFPDGPSDIIYTVSYVNPHGHDGTLAPGQKTTVHEGMEFVVRKTGRS